MRGDIFVLAKVIFFLKCFAGTWAGWILGPALNGHSSALRRRIGNSSGLAN